MLQANHEDFWFTWFFLEHELVHSHVPVANRLFKWFFKHQCAFELPYLEKVRLITIEFERLIVFDFD